MHAVIDIVSILTVLLYNLLFVCVKISQSFNSMVLFMYPYDINKSAENYYLEPIFTNSNLASDNLIAVEFQLTSVISFITEYDGILQPNESIVHCKLTYI